MAICFDQFIINVVGTTVPCDVTIASSYDPPTIAAPSASRNEVILFSYKIGSPPRTKFASTYTKSRSGAVGTPPSVTGRTFDPPGPAQNQAANIPINAFFYVTVPAYDNADAAELGESGIDMHELTIIIAEETDVVGN